MNALFVLRPAKLWAFNFGHPCPSLVKGEVLSPEKNSGDYRMDSAPSAPSLRFSALSLARTNPSQNLTIPCLALPPLPLNERSGSAISQKRTIGSLLSYSELNDIAEAYQPKYLIISSCQEKQNGRHLCRPFLYIPL